MKTPTGFRRDKLPLLFDRRRYPPTEFLLIELAMRGVWAMRMLSPAAWTLALFQMEAPAPRPPVTRPRATEVYALTTMLSTCAMFAASAVPWARAAAPCLAAIAALFIVENIQYQFWSAILRPAVDRGYKVYSATRSLLLIFLQYFQTILAFATIYLTMCPTSFNVDHLSWRMALEFSMLTMTTVSFGTIVPLAGSGAATFAALQALAGIFFFGVIASTMLARARGVDEVRKGEES